MLRDLHLDTHQQACLRDPDAGTECGMNLSGLKRLCGDTNIFIQMFDLPLNKVKKFNPRHRGFYSFFVSLCLFL